MTAHKRITGIGGLLAGVFLILCGFSLVFDWLTEGDRWEVAIKGPVWIVLGFTIILIGQELISEAPKRNKTRVNHNGGPDA